MVSRCHFILVSNGRGSLLFGLMIMHEGSCGLWRESLGAKAAGVMGMDWG